MKTNINTNILLFTIVYLICGAAHSSISTANSYKVDEYNYKDSVSAINNASDMISTGAMPNDNHINDATYSEDFKSDEIAQEWIVGIVPNLPMGAITIMSGSPNSKLLGVKINGDECQVSPAEPLPLVMQQGDEILVISSCSPDAIEEVTIIADRGHATVPLK